VRKAWERFVDFKEKFVYRHCITAPSRVGGERTSEVSVQNLLHSGLLDMVNCQSIHVSGELDVRRLGLLSYGVCMVPLCAFDTFPYASFSLHSLAT